MVMEVGGIEQRGPPKKTWCSCIKKGMKNFGQRDSGLSGNIVGLLGSSVKLFYVELGGY